MYDGADSSAPVNDPLIPAHQPVSLDESTKPEKGASVKLKQFLEDRGVFEDEERTALRAAVLRELESVAQAFTEQVCEQRGQEKEVDGRRVACRIFPFGSYLLGVCSTSSDIDVLCLFPRFVKRPDFFQILYDILLRNPNVKDLQKIDDSHVLVPIMTFEFRGVDIDLSYASLDLPSIGTEIDLLDDSYIVQLDTRGVNSVNGRRTNDIILRLIVTSQLENFRLLLRFIRIWSQARAVYGNVYGYLGGINCALLAAFTCQRYPRACAATLVLMLFQELHQWPWPEPIYINTPNVGPLESWSQAKFKDARDVMPIITPAYPAINSLQKATKSTRQRMLQEFKAGFKMTDKVIRGKKGWADVVKDTNFFEKYRYYVQVKVTADSEADFRTWLGTVESRIRRLSLNLEAIEHVEAAVTFPRPFAASPVAGSFFIALAIKKGPNGETAKVDISPETKRFLTEIMSIPDRKPSWKAIPDVVPRKNLPLFVFKGGIRPAPKAPKSKRQLPK
jgi:poly(A) polymerase